MLKVEACFYCFAFGSAQSVFLIVLDNSPQPVEFLISASFVYCKHAWREMKNKQMDLSFKNILYFVDCNRNERLIK